MKNGEDSPWSTPKARYGPSLVGDRDATNAADRSRVAKSLPTGFGSTTAATSPGGSGSNNRRRVGRVAVTILGVGAALLLVVFVVVPFLSGSDSDGFNIETAARSVVMVVAVDCDKAGSGSLVTEDGLVLTNSHVATDGGRDVCSPMVGLTDGYDKEPTDWHQAVVLVDDPEIDLTVLQILNDDGTAFGIDDRDPIPLDDSDPNLGDQIQTLGYPGIGGETMTFTSGDFAGMAELSGADYYKTTASLNPGISGGSAFNGTFGLIGVPTAGFGVDVVCEENDCTAFGDSLGLIRPIRYAIPLIEEAKRISR